MNHGVGIVVVREDKPDFFYPVCWGYPDGTVKKGEDYKKSGIRGLDEMKLIDPVRAMS